MEAYAGGVIDKIEGFEKKHMRREGCCREEDQANINFEIFCPKKKDCSNERFVFPVLVSQSKISFSKLELSSLCGMTMEFATMISLLALAPVPKMQIPFRSRGL